MGDVWCSPSLSLCCCSDWILLLCLFDGSCVRGWMVVLFWFSLDDVSCFDGVTECGLSPFMCPPMPLLFCVVSSGWCLVSFHVSAPLLSCVVSSGWCLVSFHVSPSMPLLFCGLFWMASCLSS